MQFQNVAKGMVLLLSVVLMGCASQVQLEASEHGENGKMVVSEQIGFVFPEEHEMHEGTWLQWPHGYTYGEAYRDKLEPIWVDMTRALSTGEKVHIVAYNHEEQAYIEYLLLEAGVDLEQVTFHIHKTDDVWARDNGPMFVRDQEGELRILDFGFNGWGEKTPYEYDRNLRTAISEALHLPRIDTQDIVIEPGAIELDGNGVLLATRSAIVNDNRNPGMTEQEIENVLTDLLGVEKFIWLDGVVGLEITDFHIDGFAKFLDHSTLVTMKAADLAEWGLSEVDIDRLYAASDKEGRPYDHVYLPITAETVVLDSGKDLGYRGSYVNYYVANSVVLVPFYNDVNDQVAAEVLQDLYPERTVVGIDVRELYTNGGMIHCVTQQQPQE